MFNLHFMCHTSVMTNVIQARKNWTEIKTKEMRLKSRPKNTHRRSEGRETAGFHVSYECSKTLMSFAINRNTNKLFFTAVYAQYSWKDWPK